MFDGGQGGGSRTPIVSANEDHVSVGLGDAGSYGAYAHFSYQFHRNPRLRIDILQIVD